MGQHAPHVGQIVGQRPAERPATLRNDTDPLDLIARGRAGYFASMRNATDRA